MDDTPQYTDGTPYTVTGSQAPGIPRDLHLLLVNYFRARLSMTHDQALSTVDDLDKYVRLNR